MVGTEHTDEVRRVRKVLVLTYRSIHQLTLTNARRESMPKIAPIRRENKLQTS